MYLVWFGHMQPLCRVRFSQNTVPALAKDETLEKNNKKGKNKIHRFVHETGPEKRSGGLGAGKIRDFSARVFLDRSHKPKNTKKDKKIGPDILKT